jgi:predicted dienelactone hydrolase
VPTVVALHDAARDRALPTTLYVPASGPRAPLIVFCHGMWGHPRKFTQLLSHWAAAGFVVAGPAFPHTNDESPPPQRIEDVVNQPADVSFVLDELLARGVGDAGRLGVGGFSLGGETALAAGLHPRFRDPRVRAVAAIAGALFEPEFAFEESGLSPVPLLLVHGAEDRKNERLRRALEVYEAAPEPKELLLLEGAGHDVCQDTGGPHTTRVAEATTSFWNRYLG